MEKPFFDPPTPYSGLISGGKFYPGNMVRIQGIIPNVAYRFDIQLQCGPAAVHQDDVAIQVSVRMLNGEILINSLENCIWGEELRQGAIPMKRAKEFEIALVCDFNQYKVIINGQHYCNFPQRIHYDRITHLAIHGDVSIITISYEAAPEDLMGVLPRNYVSVNSKASAPLLMPLVQDNEPNEIPPSQGRHTSSPPEYGAPPSYEKSNQMESARPRTTLNEFSTGAPNHIGTSLYPTSTPYPTSTSYPTNAPYAVGQPGIAAPYGTNGVGNSRVSPYSPSGAPYLPLPPDAPASLNLPQPPPGSPVPLNAAIPPVTFRRQANTGVTSTIITCVRSYIFTCGIAFCISIVGIFALILVLVITEN